MTEETNPQTAPETPVEDQPVQSGLVAFAEPAGPDALTAQVEETPVVTETATAAPPETPPEQPAPPAEEPKNDEPIHAPGLNAAAAAEVRHAANTQAEKEEFQRRVLAARAKVAETERPQPVAPRILSQTMAEMEAGRKLNEHHANLQSRGPIRARSDAEVKADGTNTQVMRPNNVDEYRNTFRSQAQTQSKDSVRQPPH